MSYSKEDLDDMSMNSYPGCKPARPHKSPDPCGWGPPPQRSGIGGGGGDDDEDDERVASALVWIHKLIQHRLSRRRKASRWFSAQDSRPKASQN